MPISVQLSLVACVLTLAPMDAFAQADAMSSMNSAGMALMGEASGTSMNPEAATQPSMIMTHAL